jgi:hypothetical protein
MLQSIFRVSTHVFIVFVSLFFPIAASASSLTVEPATPPPLIAGDTLVVTVGVDDVSELQGYTLDVTYDDSELTFVDAIQLGSTGDTANPGQYAQVPFHLDPSVDLANGTEGRASVLLPVVLSGGIQGESSILFIDGRTNNPVAGPAGLLRLEFLATENVVADALPDVSVGILEPTADDLTASFRNGALSVFLVTTEVSISVVPEPGFALALVLGAIFLWPLWSWRQRRLGIR